ncbi:cytochrome P450 [Nostoc sp. XA013]|nr:cytochrome P450 [Nostoc sp. XA013]
MDTREQVDMFSSAFTANPYATYAHLHKNAPIYRVMQSNGQPLWLITLYEDAITVLKDPHFVKDFRNAITPEQLAELPPDEQTLEIMERNMIGSDPPNHTRLRGLVSKAFTLRQIEQLEPRIQEIAEQLLDTVQDKGSMELISEYAFPLPMIVISEMLGIPNEDHDKFHQWSKALVEGLSIHNTYPDKTALAAAAEFFDYIRALLNEQRMTPSNNLISALILAEEQGDKLTEDELISMIYLLILAGHETTVNLIGNGILALLQHPDQLAKLKNNPSLIKSAVEEFLRYESSVQTTTSLYTKEDVEISGQVIPKGEQVMVVLGAANHDPAQFDKANELDITREINQHIAFGYGIHHCLGAPLARLEGQIAINTLLRRLPDLELAVTPEELRWRSGLNIRGLQALPVRFKCSV